MTLARRLIMVLVILTALAGSVAYFVTEMGLTVTQDSARQLGWLVFVLMTALSIILIVLIGRSLAHSLHAIRRQLNQFESDNEIGMIMLDANDDLAELVAGINHYLTHIKNRFDQKRIDRKELQIQARVAEAERLQAEAVIFSISEAVFVSNEFDELLIANRAARRLFCFDFDTCHRRPLDQVIADDELLELIRHTRCEKSGYVTKLIERPDPHSDKTLSLKLLLSCVLDSTGTVIGVVAVIHDITEEQEVARMKDEFARSVSHELKTPLSAIRAYTEMLADNEADDEPTRRRFCDIIQDQAQRLNHLIDDILNISRIESGVLHITRRPLELQHIIDDVITAIGPQAHEKNITLTNDVNASDFVVHADRDMIYHALANLVSNAVKYSYEGHEVTITLVKDQYEAVLQVCDTGAGIPAHRLDHIFDKFYRVPENNHLASGTGLGLNLVRQIVETVHHGRLGVESSPGRGSTFRIFLPLSRSEQLQPA